MPDDLGAAAVGIASAIAGASPVNRGTILRVSKANALHQVQEALSQAADNDELPTAICLIGSDHDLPHTRLPDRAGTRDIEVLTDNFFGMRQTPLEEDRYRGDILPEIPVSRLPTLDPALLARLLSLGSDLPASWQGALAVSADAWRTQSEAVLQHIAGDSNTALTLSPPQDADAIARKMTTRPHRLYFNVHGSDQTTDWYGDGNGQQPIILKRPDICVAPGAIVTSEACYGALQWPGEDSVSGSFLNQGASVFMGSTILAWGPAGGNAPPNLADLMVMGFYEGLDQGMGVAHAMLYAKESYLASILAQDEVLNPNEHNTLTSFLVYGPPMATVIGTRPTSSPSAKNVASTESPTPANLSGGPGSSTSTLDRLRARTSGSAGTKSDGQSALERVRAQMRAGASQDSTIGRVRQGLSNRLPAESWQLINDARIQASEIPRSLRDYNQIIDSIHRRLNGKPEHLRVVDYRSRGAPRKFLMAWTFQATTQRAVAFVLDEHGQIMREMVTR